MHPIRKINLAEREIVEHLVKKANLFIPKEQYLNMLIQKMEDSGMGGFLIVQNSAEIEAKRKFGKQASEFEFVDDDGVLVVVSLYLDDQDRLFEVDVCKAYFNPVNKFKCQRDL